MIGLKCFNDWSNSTKTKDTNLSLDTENRFLSEILQIFHPKWLFGQQKTFKDPKIHTNFYFFRKNAPKCDFF